MNIIILAAGKGTRMQTCSPKCAVFLNNKPMINYLIETVKEIADYIYIVVGYKKEYFKKIIQEKVIYVEQNEQLGTAHAVKQVLPYIQKMEEDTIIIPGDMPLILLKDLKRLIYYHKQKQNDLTVLSVIKENPCGYGRILTNELGKIKEIKEEKDASFIEQQIKLVNTGIYIINNQVLVDNIDKITNENSQQEYYLTDIVKIMSDNYLVDTMTIKDSYTLTGINDLQTLKQVEEWLSNERAN